MRAGSSMLSTFTAHGNVTYVIYASRWHQWRTSSKRSNAKSAAAIAGKLAACDSPAADFFISVKAHNRPGGPRALVGVVRQLEPASNQPVETASKATARGA